MNESCGGGGAGFGDEPSRGDALAQSPASFQVWMIWLTEFAGVFVFLGAYAEMMALLGTSFR